MKWLTSPDRVFFLNGFPGYFFCVKYLLRLLYLRNDNLLSPSFPGRNGGYPGTREYPGPNRYTQRISSATITRDEYWRDGYVRVLASIRGFGERGRLVPVEDNERPIVRSIGHVRRPSKCARVSVNLVTRKRTHPLSRSLRTVCILILYLNARYIWGQSGYTQDKTPPCLEI